MKKEHSFSYTHYGSLDELAPEDRELVEAAKKASATAYAPSTGFRVGAAARLADGTVIAASNQESVVGPVGVCAERNLLYYHQANHVDNPIEALAITSDPDDSECYPCGMCRQVIADSENRQDIPIRVIMAGRDSATEVDTSLDLLPFFFNL